MATITVSVVHEMWKLVSWQMCKNKVSPLGWQCFFTRCRRIMEEMVDLIEKLCDEVKTVNGFCYLGG